MEHANLVNTDKIVWNTEYLKILCVVFHVKCSLRGAIMLHNLRCSLANHAPHEYGALLHSPGHVADSLRQQGVAGAGPGAGGGAELLAAGPIVTTAGEEAVLVAGPPKSQSHYLEMHSSSKCSF